MTYAQLAWENVAEGQELPGFSTSLTFKTVAMTPFATWDFFPGHHEPEYARGQGQPDIYINTMAMQGFADRVATDWAGPETFIARRRMTMRRSAYPGDTLSGGGRVVGRAVEDGRAKVFLTIWLRTEAGVVCDVETTLILPRRAPAPTAQEP